MIQIYLNENDKVCVDDSSDGHRAREASTNRDLLKMADNLERMARLIMSVAQRRGRSQTPEQDVLQQLDRMRTEIRAAANVD